MLKSVGRFFIYPMETFQKQYHTPPELVRLLQQRGLDVSELVKAEDYIRHIGYYRLSAYFYPFLENPKNEHRFKPGASFEKVMQLYRFDRKLRLLLFNEIEKIEIAIRQAIVNTVCEATHDPFWITNPVYFAKQERFTYMMGLINKEYEKSNEDFIKHFKVKYKNDYPPAWELIEILPLGVVTRIYENLRDYKIQKKIARDFYLNAPVLQSWLTLITLTRNACCHHSRVWNKMNTITTLSMKRMQRNWLLEQPNQQKVYYNLCLIKYFIDVINPANNLKQKLTCLLHQYPTVDIKAMGFTDGWEYEPLWKE